LQITVFPAKPDFVHSDFFTINSVFYEIVCIFGDSLLKMLLFFKYEDEEKQTHLDPSSQVD